MKRLAILVTLVGCLAATIPTVSQAAVSSFRWGGMTIHPGSAADRGRFAVWLDDRAVLLRWTERHPAVAARLGKYWPPSHATVRQAVRDVFSPAGPTAVTVALCITDREAGDYWRAYSQTDDVGPFQGNIVHWRDGHPSIYELMDPLGAARWAFGLSRQATDFYAWRGGRWPCGLGS